MTRGWPVLCGRCSTKTPATWFVEAAVPPTKAGYRAAVCCERHLGAVRRWATVGGKAPVVTALDPEEAPATLF